PGRPLRLHPHADPGPGVGPDLLDLRPGHPAPLPLAASDTPQLADGAAPGRSLVPLGKTRNPKHEIRNKSQGPKYKIPNRNLPGLGPWDFGFGVCFGFRASDFGFPCSPAWLKPWEPCAASRKKGPADGSSSPSRP